MKKYLVLLLLTGYLSCQDQGCNAVSGGAESFVPVGQGVDIDAVVQQRGGVLLPNTCGIVAHEDIAEALELTVQDLEITDSSPRDNNPTHRSCFFKWSDMELSNAGILFQAMRNPVGDEYPNYVELFIESKLTTGERGMEGDAVVFEPLEGLGDAGAYSASEGKYFWRLRDKVIFSIAFNTTHTPEQQYRIARRLGYLITKNYIDGK